MATEPTTVTVTEATEALLLFRGEPLPINGIACVLAWACARRDARAAARVAELEAGLRALKSLELYGSYQTCQGLINPRIDALLAGTPPAAPEGQTS